MIEQQNPKPSLSDPCPAKYRKGVHNVYGSVCRDCGARDENLSAEVQKGAEMIAAERNFWPACEALDAMHASGSRDLSVIVEWRSRWAALRAAGGGKWISG